MRDGRPTRVTVRLDRVDPYPLLVAGWGNLLFVFALAGLATALYLRRPEEPATTPLLIAAAGLLGSTLAFVTGMPALALATGGPVLWLYNLSMIGRLRRSPGARRSPSRCSYRRRSGGSGPSEPCSQWPTRRPLC